MESMKDFEKELEESYKQFDENAFEEAETEDDEIWVGLMEKMQSKEAFSVKVKEAVKGGVVAYVDEKRAFIPASQLSDTYVEKLEDFVGQHVTVIITEVDKEKERIILSAKALLKEKKEDQKRQAQSKLKVGELYTGKVESLQP
ncbi:MAG: S1 RNA-binding domain-containing protein, partial [Lachnospiraceae bacterium]|nr:S1 RNA-binding domain-containing protein [Lachnospiraceae bacterium]